MMGFALRKEMTTTPESAAEITPEWLPGRRNRKRSPLPTGKTNSGHYVYGYWTFHDDGTKDRVIELGLYDRVNPSREMLIKTSVFNPGKQSSSLLFIHLDLDIKNKNLDPKWIVFGQISWPLVSEHLRIHEPSLFEAITYVVRSSGGKGLSLSISISPLVICDENKRILAKGIHLQTMLIKVLNSHGLGADESAIGMNRWMPNFKNVSRLLYSNEIRHKYVGNVRHFVIRELFKAYEKHPALVYIKKSDRIDDFLHPDFRMERKLALLLEYIEGFVGLGGSVTMSLGEICKVTGMDKSSFYRSFLARSEQITWLGIERREGRLGYSLTYKATSRIANRAFELLNGSAMADDRQVEIKAQASECQPEQVVDGERNVWLWQAAVKMKHSLVDQNDATVALSLLADLIPGNRSESWSLRHASGICRSIYRNQPRSQQSPVLRLVPSFISAALSQVVSQQAMGSKSGKTTDENNLDVGTPKGVPRLGFFAVTPQFGLDGVPSNDEPSSPALGSRVLGGGGEPAPFFSAAWLAEQCSLR